MPAGVTAGLAAADQSWPRPRRCWMRLEAHYGPVPRSSGDLERRAMPALARRPSISRKPAGHRQRRPYLGRGQEHRMPSAASLAALDWPVTVAGSWQRPDGSGEPPANLRCPGVAGVRSRWRGCTAQPAIFALPARYEPFGLSILEAAVGLCPGAGRPPQPARALGPERRCSSRPTTTTRCPRAEAPDRPAGASGHTGSGGASSRAKLRHRTHGRALPQRLCRPAGRAADGPASPRSRRSPAGKLIFEPCGDPCASFYFTHSLVSDWNHGNAHFLRGIVRELAAPRPRSPVVRAARRLEPPEPDRGPGA